MKDQLRDLLRVWASAGVTVERRDREFIIIGMSTPDWWPEWCERHRITLARMLPDQSPLRLERRAMAEDRPRAYEPLCMGMGS